MTPLIACPADDLMLPFMMMSAASSFAPPSTAVNALTAKIRRVLCMGSLLGRWRGNGFQVRGDSGDLCGLEVMPKARHARRAIADHLAHHVFLPAERLTRKGRTVERAGQLRLGVAHAARLIEESHADKLPLVELSVRSSLLCKRTRRRNGNHDKRK